MISAWFTHVPTFNTVEWSVSVELLMYLCFFTLARRVSLNLFSVGIVVILAKLAEKYFSLHPSSFGGMIELEKIMLCAFFFFSGGLAYYLHQYGRLQRPGLYMSVVWGLLSGLTFLTVDARLNINMYLELAAPVIVMFFLILPDLVWFDVIFQQERLILMLGNLTYASYLIHLPFLRICAYLLSGWASIVLSAHLSSWISIHPDMMTFGFFCVYVMAVYGLAYMSFKYIEVPVQTMMRRLLLCS
jgi:peptidoglycan/LPS O-acetylase OafA/YrhL